MANPFKKPTERKQSLRWFVIEENEPFDVGIDEIVENVHVVQGGRLEVIVLKFLP